MKNTKYMIFFILNHLLLNASENVSTTQHHTRRVIEYDDPISLFNSCSRDYPSGDTMTFNEEYGITTTEYTIISDSNTPGKKNVQIFAIIEFEQRYRWYTLALETLENGVRSFAKNKSIEDDLDIQPFLKKFNQRNNTDFRVSIFK